MINLVKVVVVVVCIGLFVGCVNYVVDSIELIECIELVIMNFVVFIDYNLKCIWSGGFFGDGECYCLFVV